MNDEYVNFFEKMKLKSWDLLVKIRYREGNLIITDNLAWEFTQQKM